MSFVNQGLKGLPQNHNIELLEKFQDWAPSLRKFIEFCDGNAIYTRPLYHMPFDHKWKHVPGVTILGDAAHVMSPFGGAGANLAMLDALELGIVLANAINSESSVEEREAAVAAWEEERMEAANAIAVIADENIRACVSPDAPGSVMKAMAKFMMHSELRRKA